MQRGDDLSLLLERKGVTHRPLTLAGSPIQPPIGAPDRKRVAIRTGPRRHLSNWPASPTRGDRGIGAQIQSASIHTPSL